MAKTAPSVTKAVQPSAKLEIDGQKYELVYDYNAIAEAEVATGNGCNLLHGISALFLNTMSALQLRGILYASLKPSQPTITLADAGRLIRLDTMPDIVQSISEAWALSMPEPKKANPPAAAGKAPSGD